MRNRIPALLGLSLALLSAPAAADYAPGTGVDKADADHFPAPSFLATALCFVDGDGDGAVDVDERLYLAYKTAACARVAGKDLRLVSSGAGAAASQVKGSGDADFSDPLAAVPAHALRFVDADGDGKHKRKDTAYLDLAGLAGATVGVGDLRLTARGDLPAFSVVRAGDADLGNPLREWGGAAGDEVGGDAVADAQFGEAGLVFEAGKGLYLNADGSAGDTAVEEGDVRLLEVPTPWEDLAVGAPAVEVLETTASEAAGLRLLTVRVRNVDDVTGSGVLETRVDGVVVDARATPTLAPGEEAVLVIALPGAAPEAEVEVTTQSVEAQRAQPNATPGPGPVLLVGALAAAVAVLRRR